MIVIQEQAEEKLVEAMNALKAENSAMRCIHVPGDVWGKNAVAEAPVCARAFVQDSDARMFVCGNGAVFILGMNITAGCFSGMQQVINALPKGNPAESKEHAGIFEVRVHFLQLLALVEVCLEEKRAHVRQEAEEKLRLKKKAERMRVLNMPLDENLIKSIPRRRAARERRLVLAVEDDFFTRTLLTSTLGTTGLAVTPVGSGEDALRSYVVEAPDIVFLDIDLPDITGHDVLSRLTKIDPQAFVVMLTGGGSKDNIVHAMSAGAKGFIVKPFTKEKLIQYIDKSLALSRQNGGGK